MQGVTGRALLSVAVGTIEGMKPSHQQFHEGKSVAYAPSSSPLCDIGISGVVGRILNPCTVPRKWQASPAGHLGVSFGLGSGDSGGNWRPS